MRSKIINLVKLIVALISIKFGLVLSAEKKKKRTKVLLNSTSQSMVQVPQGVPRHF